MMTITSIVVLVMAFFAFAHVLFNGMPKKARPKKLHPAVVEFREKFAVDPTMGPNARNFCEYAEHDILTHGYVREDHLRSVAFAFYDADSKDELDAELTVRERNYFKFVAFRIKIECPVLQLVEASHVHI